MEVQGRINNQVKHKLTPPKQYKVVMYNDDYTTMEFVTDVLMKIFKKSLQQAHNIMMDVHKQGKGVAGVYPYDLAMTKSQTAMMWARDEGFPFKLTVEEV